MRRYGSFRAAAEVGSDLCPASHLETGASGLLKVVAAERSSERRAFLEAFELQRQLGEARGSNWHQVLQCGAEGTECYAVFAPVEPDLERFADIPGLYTPSAKVLTETCQGILAGLIQLRKLANRPHGNLKPSSVLFRRKSGSSGGGTDFGSVLLTDLGPAEAAGRGARSDQRALGVILYQFVRSKRSVPAGIQAIPDDQPLWLDRVEKRDQDWRQFVDGLMGGNYDGQSLESLQREVQRLSRTRATPVWLLAAVAVAFLGVGAWALFSHGRTRGTHPDWAVVFTNLKKQFEAEEELKQDPDYELLKSAFAGAPHESGFQEIITTWWGKPGVLDGNSEPPLFAEALARERVGPPQADFSANYSHLVSGLSERSNGRRKLADFAKSVATNWGELKVDIDHKIDLGPWRKEPEAAMRQIKRIVEREFRQLLEKQVAGKGLADYQKGFTQAKEQFLLRLDKTNDYYWTPENWGRLASSCQNQSLEDLRKSTNDYATWKANVNALADPVGLDDLKSSRAKLESDIDKFLNDLTRSNIPPSELQAGGLKAGVLQLKKDASDLEQSGSSGGCVSKTALDLLSASVTKLRNNLNSAQSSIKAFLETKDLAEQNRMKEEGDRLNQLDAWLARGDYDSVINAPNLPATQPFQERQSLARSARRTLVALREYLRVGDYEAFFTQIGNPQTPTTPPFSALNSEALTEKASRDSAKTLFETGNYQDYSFIQEWAKQPFASREMFRKTTWPQAVAESNRWSALLGLPDARAKLDQLKLPEYVAIYTKPPIRKVLEAALQQDKIDGEAQKTTLQQLYRGAEQAFAQGEYTNAIQTCKLHPGELNGSFDTLSASATREMREREKALGEFSDGKYPNYDFIQKWGPFARKRGFETTWKAALSESNAWFTANECMKRGDAPGVRKNLPPPFDNSQKKPIAELLAWATIQENKAQQDKGEQDYQSATKYASEHKYQDALNLCLVNSGNPRFNQLEKEVRIEKSDWEAAVKALQDAKTDKPYGKFEFLERLKPYETKPSWGAFFTDAHTEKTLQAEAKKPSLGNPFEPPVANSQQISMPAGVSTNITLTGSSKSSTNLTFEIVKRPNQGALGELRQDPKGAQARVTYTANPAASGDDSFTFNVNGGSPPPTEGTVSITFTSKAPPDTNLSLEKQKKKLKIYQIMFRHQKNDDHSKDLLDPQKDAESWPSAILQNKPLWRAQVDKDCPDPSLKIEVDKVKDAIEHW